MCITNQARFPFFHHCENVLSPVQLLGVVKVQYCGGTIELAGVIGVEHPSKVEVGFIAAAPLGTNSIRNFGFELS